MRPNSHGLVELRDLAESSDFEDLVTLHLADPRSPVRELALVTDIEEMTSVGPDTLIMLTQEVARGGWMISAALRYAWERRACALIVPHQAFTGSVIDLAERLGVSLFTTDIDIRTLAIRTAIHVGVARADSLARLHRFATRVSLSADIPAALATISAELEGARVAVRLDGGAVRFSTPAEPHPHPGSTRVCVPLSSRLRPDHLVAETQDPERMRAEQVLAAASPTIRALLAEERLSETEASLPTLSVAALTGLITPGGTIDSVGSDVAAELGWSIDGDYFVVFFASSSQGRMGAAVRQLWNDVFGLLPLARIEDGWFGFVPSSDEHSRSGFVAELRSHRLRLQAFDLAAGVSDVLTDIEHAARGLREASLAARLATNDALSVPAIVEFSEITAEILPRVLPGPLAAQLASTLLPDLVADPATDELVDAVLAYLDHRGSVSSAAERLGVHRNTLQARLARAQQTGVSLSDPQSVLPMHLLLAALKRTRGRPAD